VKSSPHKPNPVKGKAPKSRFKTGGTTVRLGKIKTGNGGSKAGR
jgi:hypothetical protein